MYPASAGYFYSAGGGRVSQNNLADPAG